MGLAGCANSPLAEAQGIGSRESISRKLKVTYTYRRPPSSLRTDSVDAIRLDFHERFVVIEQQDGGGRLVPVVGIVEMHWENRP